MTKSAIRTLLSLIAGLAAGVAISASSSAALHQFAAALEPIGTTWVNAIRMTVIPLVVSLLIATIAEEKDARTVGRLGGRAVALFAIILSVLALFTFLAAPPLFALLKIDASSAASLRGTSAAAGAAPALPTFTSWLVSLVPSNPVKAAVDGAMLPVIIFTVMFATALGRIAPERRVVVSAIFRGLADAMLTIVGWVLVIAPIGVFCLAVALANRIGASVAGAVAFYLAVHCSFLVVGIAALYMMVRVFSGVPLSLFARSMLPAQLVAVSTRSSIAALPAMIEGATRVMRLPIQVSGFVLPLGVSVFRLNQAVTWIVSALFISKLYDVPLSPAQIAFVGACSVPMSFSIPGIPSGGIFISAPFFVSVGLPIEGMGILLALDAIPDVLKTLLNVTGQMSATALLARGAPLEESA